MTSTARYREIAVELRAAITGGAYVQAGQLPTEASLAERYRVSRGTIRQALAVLRADGLIASQRGSRRVVLSTTPVQSFAESRSFTQWARSMGLEPGGELIQLERRPAEPAEREYLRLAADAEVYVTIRLRTLSGVPVMVEHTTYPERVGKVVADLPTDTVSHSDVLRDHGISFVDAVHTIDVVGADEHDARLLGCAPGSLVLRERRRTTDQLGTPVEWSEDHYLPGSVEFTVHHSSGASTFARTLTSETGHEA